MSDECLICSSLDRGPELGLEFKSGSTFLDKELEIFFVLRNVLRLPSSICEELLAEKGPPSTWSIQLCSSCRTMLHEAHFVFSRIQKLVKDYEELGGAIRKKALGATPPKREGSQIETAVAKIRRHILLTNQQTSFANAENTVKVKSSGRSKISNRNSRNRAQTVVKAKRVVANKDLKKEPKEEEIGEVSSIVISGFEESIGHSAETAEINVKTEPLDNEMDEYEDGEIFPFMYEPENDTDDEELSEAEENQRKSLRKIKRKSTNNSESEDESEKDYDEAENNNYSEDEDYSEGEKHDRKKKAKSRIKRPRRLRRGDHKCSYCPNSYKSAVVTEAHTLTIHGGIQKPFGCDLCDKTFTRLLYAMQHVDHRHQSAIKSEVSNYAQPEDSKQSSDDDDDIDNNDTRGSKTRATVKDSKLFDVIFHVRERAEGEESDNDEGIQKNLKKKRIFINKNKKELPFRCSQCSFSFNNNWLLEAHILRCHYGQSYVYMCDICKNTFLRPIEMETHRKKVHPEITTPYTETGVSLESRIEKAIKERSAFFVPDLAEREKKMIYTCTKCPNVKLKSRLIAEIHLKRAHERPDLKFVCKGKDCGLEFLTDSGCKGHHSRCIRGVPKKIKKFAAGHKCPECPKNFKGRTVLDKHIIGVHRKIKSKMCDICSHLCSDDTYLKMHQRFMHYKELGLTPIRCEHCQRIFYSKRSLQSHVISAHTKEYKFKCPYEGCEWGFPVEEALKKHVMSAHTKEKPNTCEYCGKGFLGTTALTNHLRIHTGHKPYKCTALNCGKEFSDKPTFNRHVETHGNKIHTCNVCNRQFKVWHAYRQHCKTHDPNNVPSKKIRKYKKLDHPSDSEESVDLDMLNSNSSLAAVDPLSINNADTKQEPNSIISTDFSQQSFSSSYVNFS